MPPSDSIIILPDAGPLITLAYADALDALFKPGWKVSIVDMVLHEVTRSRTPTSVRIGEWVDSNRLQVLSTRTCQRYIELQGSTSTRNLGEIAVQEVMNDMALSSAPRTAIFLFEDHKIARASFLLPENCRKVSTRAFLLFLEQQGWLESAADIERKAIQSGRNFSRLRFPPA